MLFNSFQFLCIFFPLVTGLYFVLPQRWRWLLLLLASCWFYMAFVPVYILILAGTILIDYFAGILIEDSKGAARKRWLTASIVANLGVLAVFKYWNFLNANIGELFVSMGLSYGVPDLGILLPIGLSFHTFQSLAYTIEVYRGTQKAERRPGMFALYVMFFPQLVAGPIERPRNLLEQIEHPRTFDGVKAVDGLRQILWGLFKKMVIADNCAIQADRIFDHHEQLGGSTLLLGAVFFALQIYGDFSGYSDIALGCSRLLGFSLMRNFAFPYFSRDIAEFWRRWHISLSTWFRDYVYVPLGGSRVGRWRAVRNTFIIFLLSGLWHGANWTFVIWGGLNALYFLPLLLSGRNRKNMGTVAEGRWLPSPADALRMLATFLLTCLAWVFFRARTVEHAFEYLAGIASPTLLQWPSTGPRYLFPLILFFLAVEWVSRMDQHGLERLGARWPRPLRWSMYMGIATLIGLYMGTNDTPFIYFQF